MMALPTDFRHVMIPFLTYYSMRSSALRKAATVLETRVHTVLSAVVPDLYKVKFDEIGVAYPSSRHSYYPGEWVRLQFKYSINYSEVECLLVAYMPITPGTPIPDMSDFDKDDDNDEIRIHNDDGVSWLIPYKKNFVQAQEKFTGLITEQDFVNLYEAAKETQSQLEGKAAKVLEAAGTIMAMELCLVNRKRLYLHDRGSLSTITPEMTDVCLFKRGYSSKKVTDFSPGSVVPLGVVVQGYDCPRISLADWGIIGQRIQEESVKADAAAKVKAQKKVGKK